MIFDYINFLLCLVNEELTFMKFQYVFYFIFYNIL